MTACVRDSPPSAGIAKTHHKRGSAGRQRRRGVGHRLTGSNMFMFLLHALKVLHTFVWTLLGPLVGWSTKVGRQVKNQTHNY